MNTTRRQFFAWLGIVAGLFAVALILGTGGCGKSDPAGGPAASGAHPTFTATAQTVGTSMLPTFGERETVALELCAFSDLRARDTVIYWQPESRQFVHHRLTERHPTDGRWLTAGDNNPGRDLGRFTADEFIGRTRKLPR